MVGGIGSFEIGISPIGGVALPPPVTVQKTIPSYLYQQYSDDDNLQAFVDAYNTYTQAFLDWFNALNLPNYTSDPVKGPLLDWVGAGLYGTPRPIFPSGRTSNRGPLNTWNLNTLGPNERQAKTTGQYYVTSDDVYRRVITWNFFKGDGNTFNVRWLKRRIMRFILGTDGVNFNVDTTYRISVTFGSPNVVNINILNGLRVNDGGARPNRFLLNTTRPNQLRSHFIPLNDPLFDLSILLALKQGIDSGVLQLPFQFQYNVIIGTYNGLPGGGFVFGVSSFGSGGF